MHYCWPMSLFCPYTTRSRFSAHLFCWLSEKPGSKLQLPNLRKPHLNISWMFLLLTESVVLASIWMQKWSGRYLMQKDGWRGCILSLGGEVAPTRLCMMIGVTMVTIPWNFKWLGWKSPPFDLSFNIKHFSNWNIVYWGVVTC